MAQAHPLTRSWTGLLAFHPADVVARMLCRRRELRAQQALRCLPPQLRDDIGLPYDAGCASDAGLVELAMRAAGRWS